ncbi:MAG: T9SS C-terminal target domain-containing protein [Bacteroidetes bacterium]|nr:MAG: T9SS C-terminal target domain-containing protein [Bacteroidota bacterium]
MLRFALAALTCGLFLSAVSAHPGGSSEARFLATGQLTGLPNPLRDTASYDLGVFVINADPERDLQGPVTLMLSVDGDMARPVGEAVLPMAPVAPGDSFLIQVSGYQFDAARFQGGGITHDIIVWPVRLGSTTVDSASLPRDFVHTPSQTSGHLGIRSLNLPPSLSEGEAYSFSLEIQNKDPQHPLYHPVDVYLSVNGDAPTLLASHVFPPEALAPGTSFSLQITDYTFDAARFQGGGITHDIIVWPVSLHAHQRDSLVKPVRWLRGSRLGTGLGQASPGSGEGESLSFRPGSVFPNPFTGHSPVWPVVLNQGGQVRLEVIRPTDGQLVRARVFQLGAGTHLLKLDLTGLPAGTYAYRLVSPEGVQQGSIQKQTH